MYDACVMYFCVVVKTFRFSLEIFLISLVFIFAFRDQRDRVKQRPLECVFAKPLKSTYHCLYWEM